MRLYRNPSNRPSNIITHKADLQILEEIAYNEYMTPTQLKKRLGISYRVIQSVLNRHVEKGVLIEIKVGKIKIFTFNTNNEVGKYLYRFIREWPINVDSDR